ncbi:MAG: hypothetical protein QT03_C0001G1057 [archaeon GW2011_AR10]|uniref:Uncharacterized protein n=1 Tax=Candidatus Iainarchaeum sp. TaxID=3101447 RepID=A0A7J4IYN5_9ARCH|nr:MAG: hypothetical protein QT03_C0001G1057 [archaeon GW2011_AR10]HIH08076.1 hypothetical protein [Candidatus Diapherotrites archaeon]
MKKKIKDEASLDDSVYDSGNVEELLEDDELKSGEAGFLEGYNEKQSRKPKKFKRIINE